MIYNTSTELEQTAINFRSGNDIAFHLNPRYSQQVLKHTPDRILQPSIASRDLPIDACIKWGVNDYIQVVVLNTYTNQQWQGEERPPGFPLGYGQTAQVTAVVKDQTIDIFAKEFCYSYRHRYDVSKINQVEFIGRGAPVNGYVGKVCVCVCVHACVRACVCVCVCACVCVRDQYY